MNKKQISSTYPFVGKYFINIFFSLLIETVFKKVVAYNLPAFPDTEGFGRYTTGGCGGTFYYVTTLEDSIQKGTLRYVLMLMQKGTRTLIFDIAGTIFLNNNLRIVSGNLTIALQTAPRQRICIARYFLSIKADNVIVCYLRFPQKVFLRPDIPIGVYPNINKELKKYLRS